MSAAPRTVLTASPEEAAAIRAAVRAPDLGVFEGRALVATTDHAAALTALLSDPAVSDPIYDLPRPIGLASVTAWIASLTALREQGEALLLVTLDEAGAVAGYSLFTVWPERASAEIAGARRADLQGSGGGSGGAERSFGWMFDGLGVRLIGVTAALDNHRSARIIAAAGFTAMGVRDCLRPDGSARPSHYWEMTREAWQERITAPRAAPPRSDRPQP